MPKYVKNLVARPKISFKMYKALCEYWLTRQGASTFPVQFFCKPLKIHLTENEKLKEENHIIMNCPV